MSAGTSRGGPRPPTPRPSPAPFELSELGHVHVVPRVPKPVEPSSEPPSGVANILPPSLCDAAPASTRAGSGTGPEPPAEGAPRQPARPAASANTPAREEARAGQAKYTRMGTTGGASGSQAHTRTRSAARSWTSARNPISGTLPVVPTSPRKCRLTGPMNCFHFGSPRLPNVAASNGSREC